MTTISESYVSITVIGPMIYALMTMIYMEIEMPLYNLVFSGIFKFLNDKYFCFV